MMSGSRIKAWLTAVLLVTVLSNGAIAVQPADKSNYGAEATTLAGEIELVRLIDLCATRLDVNIDYDPDIISGKVTLRLEQPLTDEELWALTNRLLANRGLTSVKSDPEQFPNTYTIIKIQDAPNLAATVEHVTDEPLPPGYASIVVRVQHITDEAALAVVKQVLSKSGSTAVSLGDEGLMLLADLQPRLDQALHVLSLVDVSGEMIVSQRVVLEHQSATQLATTLTALATARQLMLGDRREDGRVQFIADTNDRSLFVIGSPRNIEHWHSRIAELDAGDFVETRPYVPQFFPLEDVAQLIESTLNATRSNRRGRTDSQPFLVVRDTLTDTLIITATPREHERIQELIDRVNAAPREARRPMRTYQIENRAAADIKTILEQLLLAGMLDEVDADASGSLADSNADASATSLGMSKNPEAIASVGNSKDAGFRTGINQNEALRHRSTSLEGEPPIWITVDDGTNTLIAVGEPRRLDQLEQLIATLDVRQAQVMIEVMIVTLSKGETFDLGVELQKFEMSGGTAVRLSSLFGLTDLGDDGTPSLSDPRGGTAVVLNPGDFTVVVRALATINDGRTVNIPKVLVNNNESAVLNSVLQEPFTSTNASDTVATTSFGGTQDAGTTVTVTPRIAEAEYIVLEYSATLSSFVGESSDPNLPPPRQQNSLQSVATIPDGYVVAVGGLDVIQQAEAVSQVPLIARAPLIGELFKNRSTSQSRSRFFVFIRPTIMRQVNFEALKHLSAQDAAEADIDDGWPEVRPRVIR